MLLKHPASLESIQKMDMNDLKKVYKAINDLRDDGIHIGVPIKWLYNEKQTMRKAGYCELHRN